MESAGTCFKGKARDLLFIFSFFQLSSLWTTQFTNFEGFFLRSELRSLKQNASAPRNSIKTWPVSQTRDNLYQCLLRWKNEKSPSHPSCHSIPAKPHEIKLICILINKLKAEFSLPRASSNSSERKEKWQSINYTGMKRPASVARHRWWIGSRYKTSRRLSNPINSLFMFKFYVSLFFWAQELGTKMKKLKKSQQQEHLQVKTIFLCFLPFFCLRVGVTILRMEWRFIMIPWGRPLLLLSFQHATSARACIRWRVEWIKIKM